MHTVLPIQHCKCFFKQKLKNDASLTDKRGLFDPIELSNSNRNKQKKSLLTQMQKWTLLFAVRPKKKTKYTIYTRYKRKRSTNKTRHVTGGWENLRGFGWVTFTPWWRNRGFKKKFLSSFPWWFKMEIFIFSQNMDSIQLFLFVKIKTQKKYAILLIYHENWRPFIWTRKKWQNGLTSSEDRTYKSRTL